MTGNISCFIQDASSTIVEIPLFTNIVTKPFISQGCYHSVQRTQTIREMCQLRKLYYVNRQQPSLKKGEACMCHNLARAYSFILPKSIKIPKKFGTTSPYPVTSSTHHRSISKAGSKDHQITSQPDDVSWIRRETLPLGSKSVRLNKFIKLVL